MLRNRVTFLRSSAISPSNAGLATTEDGVLFTRVVTTAADTTTCKKAHAPRRLSPPCVRATPTRSWPTTCWSVCHQTQNLSPRSCLPVTKTTETQVSCSLENNPVTMYILLLYSLIGTGGGGINTLLLWFTLQLFSDTLKPVQSDHPLVQTKAVFVDRWPLFAGSIHWSDAKLTTKEVTWKIKKKSQRS